MKLLKLKLKNFKGIKNLDLKANGHDLNIYGDNATGKTTILDAFMWLLFDKDSQNKADFAIKTLGKDGEPVHHLDHEVEGTFEIDGETIEFKKVYREKWTKKRGSAVEEFSGHEVDHFIDGVPVKKGEYTQRVAEIAPEDRFKLLTSPLFFNDHMKWQGRRELLIDIAGDVTMEDAIKVNPELEELPKILGKRDPDDHKAVVMAKRAEVNKELERIPIRIDEVTKGMPDIDSLDGVNTLDADLATLTKGKAEKESELARLTSGGATGELKQKLAIVESELLNLENAHKRKVSEQVDKLQAQIREHNHQIETLRQEIDRDTKRQEALTKDIAAMDSKLVALREKWHEVNARQPDVCDTETCPTCGQDLPPEQVQEAHNKALEVFNLSKAQQLEDINRLGKQAKEDQERCKAELEALKAQVSEKQTLLDQAAEKSASLQAELTKLQVTMDDYKSLSDYVAKLAEKEELQKAIEGDQDALQPEIERLRHEISLVNQAIDKLNQTKAVLNMYEQAQKRLTELERQEENLASEFERLEYELYLIELYIKTKAELLTDKINSKFRLAEFKLFETQINGGINPICETTYKGVPWGSLNSAGKVQVGLDIIRTLQEHYQFRPPVWIDNRESIVDLPEMDCQVISLIVSEKDKTLRVEGPDGEAVQQSLFEEAI